MNLGEQVRLKKACLASEIQCPRCGGNDGFCIPHLQTWSCRNLECIQANTPDKKIMPINQKIIEAKNQKKKFEECDQSEDKKQIIRNFFDNPKGFMIFAGPIGTGKTYFSQAIYDDFECEEKKIITVYDLFLEYKEYNENSEFLVYTVRKLSSLDFLVLDDLGSRNFSEAFNDILFGIADKRFLSKKPTIITTSKNSDELRKGFSDAFFSRISSGKILKFSGVDRRSCEF
jgi:DNA replication protein DnaC